MRARTAGLFVAAAVTMAGVSAATPAQAISKKLIIMKAVRTLSAGDAKGYSNYFTSGAVIHDMGHTVRGRAAIARHEAESVADGIKVFVFGMKEEGNRVNGRFRVMSKGLREAGIRHFAGFFTADFTGDLINHLTIKPDMSDPGTRKAIEMGA